MRRIPAHFLYFFGEKTSFPENPSKTWHIKEKMREISRFLVVSGNFCLFLTVRRESDLRTDKNRPFPDQTEGAKTRATIRFFGFFAVWLFSGVCLPGMLTLRYSRVPSGNLRLLPAAAKSSRPVSRNLREPLRPTERPTRARDRESPRPAHSFSRDRDREGFPNAKARVFLRPRRFCPSHRTRRACRFLYPENHAIVAWLKRG